MRRLLCWLGFHDFSWPPHHPFMYDLWTDVGVECHRGCGARQMRRCRPNEHWAERHPDDEREAEEVRG